MRLRPEQLNAHLNKQTLAPIYFVCGDEPLQKLEAIDEIRRTARNQGFEERTVFNVERGFDWDSINRAGDNLSLFSTKKILELRMAAPKPGKDGGKALLEYTEKANEDNLLIISADKLERASQNTKWVKALEKTGVLIQIWPINPDQLPGWLQTRAQRYNKALTLDAAKLIALRVEGNLLAARQEIDKLQLLVDNENIDVDDVIAAVADSSRYNVFDMIESAYLGQTGRTLAMLKGLQNEGTEPLALFGAIMWEFRRTCSMSAQLQNGANLDSLFNTYRIWDQKKRPLKAVLQRHKSEALKRLLAYCASIDKTIKSAAKDRAWDQLSTLLLGLADTKTINLENQY